MEQQFYLQDSRGYVGNDILWWRKGNKGYTTNLEEAALFSRSEATAQNQDRHTDIPWPKDYIDQKARPAVDMQYVDIKEALSDTDIKLNKPKPRPKEKYRCFGCGRFMTIYTYYGGPCINCETDNRP